MKNLIKHSVWLMVVGNLLLGGCQPQETREAVAPAAENTVHPVICHLKTRDKLITVSAGLDGALYSVKSVSGSVLAVHLSATELSTRFPELKAVVEQGIADWAGMDPIDQRGR